MYYNVYYINIIINNNMIQLYTYIDVTSYLRVLHTMSTYTFDVTLSTSNIIHMI